MKKKLNIFRENINCCSKCLKFKIVLIKNILGHKPFEQHYLDIWNLISYFEALFENFEILKIFKNVDILCETIPT